MDINCEALGFSQQEYDRNRAILLRKLNSKTVEPFSWIVFKKTDEERAEMETAKANWRAYMRVNGLSKRCGKVNAG